MDITKQVISHLGSKSASTSLTTADYGNLPFPVATVFSLSLIQSQVRTLSIFKKYFLTHFLCQIVLDKEPVCWLTMSQSLGWKGHCAAPWSPRQEHLIQHIWNVSPAPVRTGPSGKACPTISRTGEHLQAGHYAVQIVGLGVSETVPLNPSSATYRRCKLPNLEQIAPLRFDFLVC